MGRRGGERGLEVLIIRSADKMKVFADFMYAGEEINDLETLASMLYCGAFERSYDSHIESIMEPFASQNQKEILTMWV